METQEILIEDGLQGVEKFYTKKLRYIQTVAWIIFIAFIFASYFGLQKAEQCERKDRLIQQQNDSIIKYHTIINEVQDSLDASDVITKIINRK